MTRGAALLEGGRAARAAEVGAVFWTGAGRRERMLGWAAVASWAGEKKKKKTGRRERNGPAGLGLRFTVLPISLPFSFSNSTQTNLNSNQNLYSNPMHSTK